MPLPWDVNKAPEVEVKVESANFASSVQVLVGVDAVFWRLMPPQKPVCQSLFTLSVATSGLLQTPLVHVLLKQSLAALHVLPSKQSVQLPPQSMSDSSPSLTPFVQSPTHTPLWHLPLQQSFPIEQVRPSSQGTQFGPPQGNAELHGSRLRSPRRFGRESDLPRLQ
jgi:hypothetical protein